MNQPFVHLNVHTGYDLLDSAIRIEPLMDRVAALAMPAVAITDTMTLAGAVKFARAARERGIRPIIGTQVRIADGFWRAAASDKPTASRLTLLARDRSGYEKILWFMYVMGDSPRMDRRDEIAWELIGVEGMADGLIVVHEGLFDGTIPSDGDDDLRRASEVASWYREVFGETGFYLAVSRTGRDGEARADASLMALSRRTGIPLVATNDCRFLLPEDREVYTYVRHLGTHPAPIAERPESSPDERFVKSHEEMLRRFADLPEACAITAEIAARCDCDLRPKAPLFPAWPPDRFMVHGSFRDRLETDLDEEVSQMLPLRNLAGEEYVARLKHELDLVGCERRGGAETSFADYLIVVRECIDFARETGIPVGPGRGAAGASLINYLFGITAVDPVRYRLPFERFFNPARSPIPDLDIEVGAERRDELMVYFRAIHRPFRVARAAAYRTAGRHQDPRIEGLPIGRSLHSSGIVITPRETSAIAPVFRTPQGEPCTEYDASDLDAVGVVKLDLLGLRALDEIDQVVARVNAGSPWSDKIEVPLRFESLPGDDTPTWRIFREGRTAGVFLSEPQGMRDLMTRAEPRSLTDLATLIALYRPGPLDVGATEDYLARRTGDRPVTYPLPALEPILADTCGLPIFQEQIMEVAMTVAGFTGTEADDFRLTLAKGTDSAIESARDCFLAEAARNGYPDDGSRACFTLVESFGGIAFCKAHAIAYAMITYAAAWLKAHYPTEFVEAFKALHGDSAEEVARLVREIEEETR